MEKNESIIETLKKRYDRIEELLKTIELKILNKKSLLEETDEMLINLSKLLEETFTHYEFNFFIAQDYFKILFRIRKLLSKENNEIVWKLYQYSQLIISNTRNSNDMNKIFKLEGFHLFFLEDEKYLNNDEIVDYFINIMKSIILKLDENSDFDLIKKHIVLVLELNNHSDNLVRTTVSNIVLFLIRLNNRQVQNYLENFPFLFHFLDIVRNIGKSIFRLDSYILKSDVKMIKNEIMTLQDNLHFIEEIIECALSDKIKRFVKNSFIIGVILQTILPTFRQDLKFIKLDNKMIGINTGLFLLNQIFYLMEKSGLRDFLIFNFFLKDNINYKINDILNIEHFYEGSTEEIQKSLLIKKMHELDLLMNDKKTSCVILELFVVFMRSKDDNMVLLTSNLFLFILEKKKFYIDITKNSVFKNLASYIIDLLSIDPSFRLITCKKLSKLLYLIVEQNEKKIDTNLIKNVIRNFKMRLENQKKLLMADHLRNTQISIFHNIADTVDIDNFWEIIKPELLNWLSVFNYNFAKIDSKELRYLDIDYKYDFTSEDYLEMEMKMMILFKNLRYYVDDNSVLMEYEKNIKKSYKENFTQIQNMNYYDDNVVEVDLENTDVLKKLVEGKTVKHQFLILTLFGRDFILFEKLQDNSKKCKILSRNYYADILYYFDRSNPCQLNISSKKKITFWGFLFSNVKSCIIAKEILDKVTHDLKNMEFDFILKLIRKYEADCIY